MPDFGQRERLQKTRSEARDRKKQKERSQAGSRRGHIGEAKPYGPITMPPNAQIPRARWKDIFGTSRARGRAKVGR